MTLILRLWLLAVLAAVLTSAASAASATSWSVVSSGARGKAGSAVQPAATSTPTATCVSPTGSKVTVAWSAVSHATTYTVYQATASAGTYASAATVSSATWTSGTLTSGSTYYWKVVTNVGTNWASARSSATSGRTITSSGCS